MYKIKYSKSQTALEYILIIGFLLIALIPIFYYSLQRTTTTTSINQASSTVNIVADAVDYLYTLGPGSKDYVWIVIPPGVEESDVGNKEVLLKLNIAGEISDIHASTKVDVAGSIPTERGTHRIAIEVLNSTLVKIEEIICECLGLECDPVNTGMRCGGCHYDDDVTGTENEAAENCKDEKDNDCDGECDYDGCPGYPHGDDGCPVDLYE